MDHWPLSSNEKEPLLHKYNSNLQLSAEQLTYPHIDHRANQRKDQTPQAPNKHLQASHQSCHNNFYKAPISDCIFMKTLILLSCFLLKILLLLINLIIIPISEVGKKAPDKKIATKYVVIACLNKLENIGYTLPTLSSLTIQAIDAGLYHDVVGFCARIA